MNLSNQAIGSIMMALQKGILEQTDITQLLQDFSLIETEEGLIVENPPIVNVEESDTETNA
tara:strand:- start:76 stop:258 length:183 start_codon:yes stop_codon:yes gene_type:complete